MIKIKYDGVTINDQIRGFKVKSVTGRELLGAEIKERDRPILPGADFISRNYPTRDIEVAFQIQAPTEEAYRIRFNKLNALLNKKKRRSYSAMRSINISSLLQPIWIRTKSLFIAQIPSNTLR